MTVRLALRFMAVGFVALTALGERAALGKDIAAQLDYEAAPGCPRAADFEAIVAGRLGYSPFRADAAERIVVRIVVRGDAPGRSLEGRLEWRNDAGAWAGERTFPSRSGDCAELARAMGFALALQFQLLATTDKPPDAPIAPPTAEPPPPAPSSAPPVATTQPAPAAPSRPSFSVGAGVAAGLGLAPDLSGVGRVFGNVAWSRAAVELAAEVSVPSTASRRQDGAGFSQQLFMASLAGCGLHTRWSACALAKVGELRVAGDAVDVPRTSAAILVQTGARLGVTQAVGRRVDVVLHGDGLVLLTRGVVTIDGMAVWTTPRVSAQLGLDLAIRFH